MSTILLGWEIFGDYARFGTGDALEVGFDEGGIFIEPDGNQIPWYAISAAKPTILGWWVASFQHSEKKTEVRFTPEGIELWTLGFAVDHDLILPWIVIETMQKEAASSARSPS